MNPTEFRAAMEKLQEPYKIPKKQLLEMIDSLGMISQTYLRDGGVDAQRKYLMEQYIGYRAWLHGELKQRTAQVSEVPPS